jgi:hypothetical protein
VAYSTINLNYYEKIVAAQSPDNTFIRKVGVALQAGWQATLSTFLACLTLWPFLLVLVAATLWLLRYLRRRRVLALANQ